MKTLEIIDRLPVGEVVPKRVLAVLKQAGKIDTYSQWGYLDGKCSHFIKIEYKGRYFETKYLSGCFCPYLVKADIRPKKRLDYLQFKGDYKPSLDKTDILLANAWDLHYKADPNINCYVAFIEYYMRKKKLIQQPQHRECCRVNRTMSLWGTIC